MNISDTDRLFYLRAYEAISYSPSNCYLKLKSTYSGLSVYKAAGRPAPSCLLWPVAFKTSSRSKRCLNDFF